MNHLNLGWRIAAASRSTARLQHVFLPVDPNEAHQLLVGLSGRTASRWSMASEEGATSYDHARLADIAATGGFSHHPTHGAGPSSGWMASYEAPEGSGIGQVHKMHELTPEHIADHRHRVSAHLQEPDSYQGGWHDKSTGDVYLDASRHFDHELPAKDFAVQQKQKAIFKLDDFTERFIDPHQDPVRTEDHGEWLHRYHGNTQPHPGWHSYSHMYPDTDEQAAARTPRMDKGAMRGRVAHPGQGWPRW